VKNSIHAGAALSVLAVLLTACGGGDGAVADAGAPVLAASSSVASFDGTNLATSLLTLPIEALSDSERASLAFTREEEKLAQDVYTRLGAQWGTQTRVFGNIAKSEATHTETVRQLLLRYAVTDPAANLPTGVYQDAVLQALYTKLVTAGAVSLIDALKVGGAIEEIDMIDLNKAMTEVDNQDITLVYQNLLKGSRNHLRAFVNAMAAQGVVYAPQYMALADYLAIVNSPMER